MHSSNAVILHQLHQAGHLTSGISTTPHLSRAEFYARGKDKVSDGYVLKIDRHALEMNDVKQHVVANYCKPSVPEDDEVVLETINGSPLPKSVVVEVIYLSILGNGGRQTTQ